MSSTPIWPTSRSTTPALSSSHGRPADLDPRLVRVGMDERTPPLRASRLFDTHPRALLYTLGPALAAVQAARDVLAQAPSVRMVLLAGRFVESPVTGAP